MLESMSERALMHAFERTTREVSAYRTLFAETGRSTREVTDVSSFRRLAPLLGKHNTFQRFGLEELTVPGSLTQLASVLTSSGQGGRFAFGLSTRAMHQRAQANIEFALQLNFQVDERPTLLVNCLPMGVHFSAGNCTVADVSVREDMALALLEKFKERYAQFIIACDPLFLKRLLDEARRRGFGFEGMRTHLILGEETFGENFRSYVGRALHVELEKADHALLGSSMGVGELGLNLFFETRAAIRLRRAAFRTPGLLAELLGRSAVPESVPLVFCYSPLQYSVESVGADGVSGFGQLAISTLSPDSPLPLLRYATGDSVRLISREKLDAWASRFLTPGSAAFPLPVVLIRGREADVITGQTHVSEVKDVLYTDDDLAHEISGAFRVTVCQKTVDVQLRKGSMVAPETLATRVQSLLVPMLPDFTVRAWRYEQFPFGMELDYERKFKYLA